jgi:phosphoribosylaminoimidazole carboxylase PurK protein
MKYDIGFLGGGQLARMSIQAAQRIGLKCLSLDPGEETPASQLAPALISRLDDAEKIAEVFRSCERVTLENEFIPAEAIRKAFSLAGITSGKLMPSAETLATIQDKLLQRHALSQVGIPSPKAAPLDDDGRSAIQEIGFPMVLKSRFGGYDGKGTRYAKTEEELRALESDWRGNRWLAEQFVPFKRELAAIVYLSEWGAGCFPTMETVQTNHVCDLVFPSGVDASKIALAAVEAVGGHGLFGVEMFELESGEVLINEIAPRPHNTGHYSLDWGGVSQFEQHVRCVMGFPLAKTEQGYPVCMANLLGQSNEAGDLPAAISAAMSEPGVHVHWYGKAESRIGRKMGHLNVVGHPGEASASLAERAVQARDRFFKCV